MERIVVGVDGSPQSKAALRWAVAEARLRSAALRAVYALSGTYSGAPHVALSEEEVEDSRRDGERTLEGVLAEFDLTGVDVERQAVPGEPADVLVRAAQDAELLVVGLGGQGALAEHLHGSVGQQCAHRVGCPVVLVRDGAD